MERKTNRDEGVGGYKTSVLVSKMVRGWWRRLNDCREMVLPSDRILKEGRREGYQGWNGKMITKMEGREHIKKAKL